MTHPTRLPILLFLSVFSVTLTVRSAEPKPGSDWPSFRGIHASGVAEGFPTLTTWNIPKKQGLRWRVAVDGLGTSSPIIWGDRVCTTTAVSGKLDSTVKIGLYGDITSVEDNTSHTWKVICLNKKTGSVVVDTTIHTSVPKIKRHTKSTHANSTLATDGNNLVAMLGSEGLYTLDMNGKVLWKKDLGMLDSGYHEVPQAQWEFGSSPIIHEGVVLIQADVQKNSFLAAFDVKDGRELWRTARQDVPTWSTPTIHRVGNQTQVLVNGWHHIGAYDFKTGREIWKINGGGDIPVPTPVTGLGFVYITSAHGPMAPVYAIREDATGDISLPANQTSNTHIAWSVPRGGAYMATPILYRDLLYVMGWNGVLLAFDPRTGERLYQERVGAGTTAFTASPVAADGKIYITSEEGDVFVVRAGRVFQLLATNPLGEIGMASPAISEGVLYFRAGKSMMAIGQ